MNKLQEAYGRIVDDMETCIGADENGNINQLTDDVWLIQDLVNERIEFESRKYKLVVGSEWECVVECYGAFNFIDVGERVRIIDVFGGEGLLAIQYLDSELFDQLPISQCLYCFEPVMKGE